MQTVVSSGSLALSEGKGYDLNGRITIITNFDGTRIDFSYSADTRTTTETFPGGITKISNRYLDGRLKSVTGTGLIPEYHDYDTKAEAYQIHDACNVERVYTGADGGPRWAEELRYTSGALAAIRKPEFGTTNLLTTVVDFINPVALLHSIETPVAVLDGIMQYHVETFSYDRFAGLEPYSEETASYADSRLKHAETIKEYDGNYWWQSHLQMWYGDSGIFTNVTRERLSGFTSTNILTDATYTDHEGNVSIITISLEKANKKVTAVTNTPHSTINITAVSRNGLLQSINTDSVLTPTYFYYDGLRREIAQKSPLGIITGTAFHPATGWVIATTNAAQQVTLIEPIATNLANAGLPKWIQLPNGKKTYFEYNSRGQQTRMWGDVPYPEERVYDSTYGHLIQLKTYRGGSSWPSSSWLGAGETADVTTWNYDAATGLLLSKMDAAGQGYTNNYDRAHALTTRTWARGVTVTNRWNGFGQILSKEYSDGTPGFEVTAPLNWGAYNALGQPRVIIDEAAGYISSSPMRPTAI